MFLSPLFLIKIKAVEMWRKSKKEPNASSSHGHIVYVPLIY